MKTSEIRHRTARAWRERDPHAVWFWGSWLLVRWQVLPVLGALLGFTIGVVLAVRLTS